MAGNKNTGALLVPKNEGISLVSMFLSKFHISTGLSFPIGHISETLQVHTGSNLPCPCIRIPFAEPVAGKFHVSCSLLAAEDIRERIGYGSSCESFMFV